MGGPIFWFVVEIIKAALFCTAAYYVWTYFLSKAITIPCLACEQSTTFVKCMPGTGVGTHTCDAWNQTKQDIANIRDDLLKVKGAISDVASKIAIPVNLLKDALVEIEKIKDQITITIPHIPPLRIPLITPWTCAISLDGIKPFDVCADLIQPIVNDAVAPINATINGSVGALNDAINGINNVTKTLGIPNIPPIPSSSIAPVNISCKVDLAADLKTIGIDGFDPCGLLSTGINDGITGINTAIAAAEDGINVAIDNINSIVRLSITTIHDVMLLVVAQIKIQLQSLNIFAGLFDPITNLYREVKAARPLEVAWSYISDGITIAAAPFGGVINFLLIVAVFFIVGFAVYCYMYIQIAMYPLVTMINVLYGFFKIFIGMLTGISPFATIRTFNFVGP